MTGDAQFANPAFYRAYESFAPELMRRECVVFCGRSNVGKSSVINALCNGRFARVSRAPGRTQSINLYALAGGGYFADLPGYGYAAVARDKKAMWQKLMTRYVCEAPIRCLVLIVDCRRGLGAADESLLNMYLPRGLPAHILLNKCDKINRQRQLQVLAATAAAADLSATLFSATKGAGIAAAKKIIRAHFA